MSFKFSLPEGLLIPDKPDKSGITEVQLYDKTIEIEKTRFKLLYWGFRNLVLDDYEFLNLPSDTRVHLEALTRDRLLNIEYFPSTIERWKNVTENPSDDSLFIIFAGSFGGAGKWNPDEFLGPAGLLHRNCIIIRDISNQFYTQGVSKEASSMPELLSWLATQREKMGIDASNVYTLGTSMGAPIAIMSAHYLRAKTCWAFAPSQARPNQGVVNDGLNWNIPELLSKHNGITEYHIYFNESVGRDARVAKSLEQTGVTLHPQPGKGHRVISHLSETGQFENMFEVGNFRREVRRQPKENWKELLQQFLLDLKATHDWESIQKCLHFDSLELVQLALALENIAGVLVEPTELKIVNDGSFEELCEYCEQKPKTSVATVNGGSKEKLSTIQVGMPMLSHKGVSESELLKKLGDIQWTHLTDITGIPTKELTNKDGDRLYPAFFFVSIMSIDGLGSFEENDLLEVKSRLSRTGLYTLDGVHNISKEGSSCVVELCNVLLRKKNGAHVLERATPANQNFRKIPEKSSAALQTAKSIKKLECAFAAPSGYNKLNKQPLEWQTKIDPERDVNGAGLVYFANYPVFFDRAERHMLSSLGYSIEEIKSRTVVDRQTGYYANADASDGVIVRADFSLDADTTYLYGNFKMYRKSDNKLMAISSVIKKA